MDIVNGRNGQENSCTPFQVMHVYQHVNSENLESSVPEALKTAFLKGSNEAKCSPQPTARHESQSNLNSDPGKYEVR